MGPGRVRRAGGGHALLSAAGGSVPGAPRRSSVEGLVEVGGSRAGTKGAKGILRLEVR